MAAAAQDAGPHSADGQEPQASGLQDVYKRQHEDNALLLPFLLCAAILYVVFLVSGRAGQLPAKLALLAVPLALWGGCVAAWCGMNQKVYGRFIVSDFTSSEFSDAMGALARACPEDQDRYLLVPVSYTHLDVYKRQGSSRC